MNNKMIGIWSPKGGCGKSFLAANLGAYIASQGIGTGIIDANRQCSSVDSILDIEIPKGKGLKPAMYSEEEKEIVRNFHENPRRHKNLQLLALNRDDGVDDLHELERRDIESLFRVSRESFELLIIDLPTSYLEYTSYLGWFNVDNLLIVIDNDINSVYALRKYMAQFTELNIDRQKITLILNKNMGAIDVDAVELLCGLKVFCTIPYSKRIVMDMNNSRTIFMSAGTVNDFRIKKAIKQIGKYILNR